MKLHPESLPLEYFLDPSPNISNFFNPNHMLNILISPGYLIINAHLHHISPFFIPQASKFQNGVTIRITSLMNSSSSSKPQLKPTSKRLMINKLKMMRNCSSDLLSVLLPHFGILKLEV